MKYFIQTPMKKNILIWGIAVGELEGTWLLKRFTMGKVVRKPGANLENQDSNPGTLEYNAVMLANNKPMRSLAATFVIFLSYSDCCPSFLDTLFRSAMIKT